MPLCVPVEVVALEARQAEADGKHKERAPGMKRVMQAELLGMMLCAMWSGMCDKGKGSQSAMHVSNTIYACHDII